MSSSSEPVRTRAFIRSLILLIVVLLIVPCTLKAEQWSQVQLFGDSNVKRDLIAVLWVFTRNYGTTNGEPFDTLSLSSPDAGALLWSVPSLVASVLIFYAVRRFSGRVSVARLRWGLVAFLVLWAFLPFGFLAARADGVWSLTLISLPSQQISAAAIAWYPSSDKREHRET